jgi:SNF2 family DNA or RNA helicase
MHSAAPPVSRKRNVSVNPEDAVAIGTHDPARAERCAPVVPPLAMSHAVARAPVRAPSRFHPYAHPANQTSRKEDDALKAAWRKTLEERAETMMGALQASMEKERQDEKDVTNALQRDDPDNLGSTAAVSTQEMNPDELKFVETLIKGAKDKRTGETKFQGIMREKNALGQRNLPYTHQRNFVRQMAKRATKAIVGCHDPGLGKTASGLMAYCAECVMQGRRCKMLISVPAAVMDQWYDSLIDWVRDVSHRILVTSRLKEVTEEALLKHDIVILSKDTVGRAYATCFKNYPKHHQIQTGPGLRWVSAWDRIGVFGDQPMPPLHPIFAPPNEEEYGWFGSWDLFIIDEVHNCRTHDSRLCEAHSEVAHTSIKRCGMTGTPLVNKTQDFGGIAKALNTPRTEQFDFQSKHVWNEQRCYRKVNREAVIAFTAPERFSRATEKILNLPNVDEEVVNYDVRMAPEDIVAYNSILADARSLKIKIERSGQRASKGDLERLMAMLMLMQQYVVSPLLAQNGVKKFKSEQHLFQVAASNDHATGAFYALAAELTKLHSEGHRRVVIAANHTSIMRIVRIWIERNHPEFGRVFVYDGDLNPKERVANKKGFLQSECSLLFLSVLAGGVGLHLVPGCEAMIFWGSLPFSPAHTRQCLKRIHRIGQLCPLTGQVSVRYLIPHGSIDGAIGKVHTDKQRLMDLCVDGDNSGFSDQNDNEWRKHSRIVDEAKELQADGNFAPMPLTQPTPDGGVAAFTLLPGVRTRGIPELEQKMEQLQVEGSSAAMDLDDPLDLPAWQRSAVAAASIAIDADDA